MRASLGARVARASLAADAAWNALAVVREELAFAFVAAPDRAALTASLYARRPAYRAGSEHTRRGLFEWEAAAVDAHFPTPPARVLVASCGAGRELLALAARGYAVAGYDASGRAVDEARLALAASAVAAPVEVATHDDFARTAPDAGYDAIIVGWGGLAHALGASARVRLFEACRRAAPRGPLLVSFLSDLHCADGDSRKRLRAALRGALARVPGATVAEPGDVFDAALGFAHRSNERELRDEARRAGYDAAFVEERSTWQPHAVLVPARR